MKLDLFAIATLLGTVIAEDYWNNTSPVMISESATPDVVTLPPPPGTAVNVNTEPNVRTAFLTNKIVVERYFFTSLYHFFDRGDLFTQALIDKDNMKALYHFCSDKKYMNYFTDLKADELSNIFLKLSGSESVAALFFQSLDPEEVSKSNLAAAALKPILKEVITQGRPIQPRFFDGFTSDFYKKNDIAKTVAKALKGHIHKLNEKTFKILIKDNPKNSMYLDKTDIENIFKNADLAKHFQGDVFENIDETVLGTVKVGNHVRNLPNSAFTHVKVYLSNDCYRFMTADQAKQFQSKVDLKDAKAANVRIRPELIDYQVVKHLRKDVWVAYFSKHATGHVSAMQKWHFWRRIPDDTFRLIVKQNDINQKFPKASYARLSKKQRQIILDYYGKSDGPGCSHLSKNMFAGRQNRIFGLNMTKDCFDKLSKKTIRFKAIGYGAVKPECLKEMKASEIEQYMVTVNHDGKKDKSYHLKGVLTLNNLRSLPNGADYVNNIFDKDNDDILKACKKIDNLKDLKHVPWLQPLLPHGCIKQIPKSILDFKTARKLHPNVWSNFGKDQINEMIKGKEDWKSLKEVQGPWLTGFARNKAFAKLATYQEEKESKSSKKSDEEDIPRRTKTIISYIPDEIVKEYIGADFVKNAPTDADHLPGLIEAIPRLHPSALAAVNAKFIRTHFTDSSKIPDAVFGQAATGVPEAESYAASLTAIEIGKMSETRFSNASDMFVSQMSTTALAALSPAQVKNMPAEALCLLCGDKAKAIKVELSAEQRKSLGSKCEGAAADGSMAPCPYSVGAMLTLAAAAAGSAALML